MFNLYQGDYKRYLIIPAVLFLVFLFLIFVYPGITPGIDLKGGTSIVVRASAPLEANLIETALKEKYSFSELQIGEVSSPTGYGLFIQFSEETDFAKASSLLEQAETELNSNPENAKRLAAESIEASSKFVVAVNVTNLSPQDAVAQAKTNLVKADQSLQLGIQNTIQETYSLGDDLKIQKTEIGPSLGENFYSTSITVALIGMFLVVIVVFIFFREFVPSAAIIGALFFDIFGALAMMSLFKIPLSLATIPALLMLIGYSVDTDIMLTSRVLKRKDDTPRKRAEASLITGLTMTLTTLGALTVMSILSYFGQIEVVFQISIVLLFGLLADLISTWLMNAPILLWYEERKEMSG